MQHAQPSELGPCPLCGREMLRGPSLNRHHLTPKSRGGREQFWIHRVCHGKIHSLFTEKELERDFASFDVLRAVPEIATFIRWVRKKPPTFTARNKRAGSKGGRRK